MKMKAIGIVGQVAVKSLSKAKFWACRHTPEILSAAGTIGFGGTIYLTIKGTKKAQEHEEIVDKVKDYAPAAVCGSATLGCFLGGNHILKKRNVALVSAYSVLDAGFRDYRSRVVEKYGEEEDFRLKNGLTVEKETVTEIGEDGKKHKKKVDVNVLDGEVSGYSFIYDEDHSMMDVSDPYISRNNLMIAQNSANVLLQSRGYLLLNEVLRSIGLHETSAGAIVGWQTKGNGDGFVDFRVKQVRSAKDPEGLCYILDFNVDGPIYQDIDKYTRI